MSTSARAQHGILLVIAAMACFSALDSVSKFIGSAVPVVLAMSTRFMFQVVVTGGVLFPQRGRALLRTRHPWLHLVRGLLLLAASSLAFLSLQFMPMAEFTAMIMLTPLVITLFAAYRLGERVSPLRWLLVAVGFVGAMMVIRPDGEDFAWHTLLPLGVVVANTAFQLLTARLAQVDDAGTMHFYTGCVGAAIAIALTPFFWQVPGTASLWGLLLLIGILSSLGHFLLILGYGRASPATVSPFLYTQIAFATLAGWVVFANAPDGWAIAGIAVITASGVAATWLTARDAERAKALRLADPTRREES